MNKKLMFLLLMSIVAAAFLSGCVESTPVSDSGVSKTSVEVPVGGDGLTTEQRNIRDKNLDDNRPGAIKYLYVVSSYSGQVLLSDVVKGKVTSSGKRLNPYTVSAKYNGWCNGFGVNIGDTTFCTQEVLQDDGTYGSSIEYLYYWNTNGIRRQIYISGGQMVIVSDQPMAMNGVVLTVETLKENAAS